MILLILYPEIGINVREAHPTAGQAQGQSLLYTKEPGKAIHEQCGVVWSRSPLRWFGVMLTPVEYAII